MSGERTGTQDFVRLKSPECTAPSGRAEVRAGSALAPQTSCWRKPETIRLREQRDHFRLVSRVVHTAAATPAAVAPKHLRCACPARDRKENAGLQLATCSMEGRS